MDTPTSWSGAGLANHYLDHLNGTIHLVHGNHDRNSVRNLTRWGSSHPMRELRLDGHKLILCHYAMRVWNNAHHGALMLYGHSHGSLPGNSQSLDVGVDAWDFTPTTLPQILERMATLPAFASEDHHTL